ncbi:hypothetical protein M1N16_08370 [Nitrospinaceae bacterium]|nr:hypothetical protein [Nitrospinaceae bacterium]
MFKNIFILIVLYLILTLDFSCFKSFDSSCMESVQDKLSGIFKWIIDFVENTFIPFVDGIFESDYWKSLDQEKSLAGNLVDNLKK